MQTVKDTEITNEAFKKITIEKKHPKNSKQSHFDYEKRANN